jgi:TPR repeat protein
MYAGGYGVPKDVEKARPLLSSACSAGLPLACQELERLGS